MFQGVKKEKSKSNKIKFLGTNHCSTRRGADAAK